MIVLLYIFWLPIYFLNWHALFINGNSKTEIKCIKHDNVFTLSLQKHLKQNDGGCNKCNKNYSDNMLKDTIEKSKIKFNDNYDYTNFKYILATTKSELKCKNIIIFLIFHSQII